MIKKLIRELAVVFLLMILFVIPARAAEDTITLEANGNKVTVTLTPAAGSEEEIRSLQVSFEISSKEGKPPKENDVSFAFNNSVKSDVKEFRYQESTGILTIYLSGGQDILSGSGNDRKASLGEIVLLASSEYTVRMTEGSLTTVNGAFDMEENKGASSTVTVGSGNSGATNPSGGGSGGGSGNGGGWSSNESDGRRPSSGTTSNRFPSFVTNTNTAPNPGVVIKPAVTPSSSETTASNEQDNGNAPATQQSSPAENGSTASPDNNNNNNNKNSQSPSVAQNTPSGTGNNGNNGDNGTGSAGDGKEKEKEGETMNKEEASGSQITVSEETQSPDETVTEAPEETQKETEDSVQTNKKAENEKKGLNVTWLIIIFAVIAVACAAAVLVMQASDNPKWKKRFKK